MECFIDLFMFLLSGISFIGIVVSLLKKSDIAAVVFLSICIISILLTFLTCAGCLNRCLPRKFKLLYYNNNSYNEKLPLISSPPHSSIEFRELKVPLINDEEKTGKNGYTEI